MAAVQARIDADFALGRHAELVSELAALVAEHPLREELHARPMLACYRSGRVAEALAAHWAARQVPGEESAECQEPPDALSMTEAVRAMWQI